MSEPQWILFFRREAPGYMENIFTKNTVAEVDFMVRELGMREGQSILDIGCGTGRHSVELARRGFHCTGIDQSAEMLEIARAAAEDAGVEITLVRGDASVTRLEAQFDHAICLCEGAFSLLEPGVEPVRYHEAILTNIHAMLKSGAHFLLTALSAFKMIREHEDEDIAQGRFDLMTTSVTAQHPGPGDATVTVVEKGFMPSELRAILESGGFEIQSMWGGTAGNWGRRPLELDEYEIMTLARKQPSG
jgi:2-polyprenyl-3-methyl-5-hydroxy-6-metoxy-1,4-benzoquinol methylase